jgi:hypothetical protein
VKRTIPIVFAVLLVAAACGDSAGDTTTTDPQATTVPDTTTTTAPGPGPDDPDAIFALLRDGCAAGDYAQCDVLFLITPLGSDLEAFGDSCGERNDPAGWCVDIYGVSVDLGVARSGCEAGDMLACDMLYAYTPLGSLDEEYGYTCGGRNRDALGCVLEYGMTTTIPPGDVGGGADVEEVLEALRQGCADADYAMCDILYLASPVGSVLEAYGDSCGNRNEPAGWCVDIYGVPVDLDALYDECAQGDMLGCDMLYAYSPLGSDDEEFGFSCAGLGREGFACVTEWGFHS